MTLRAWFGVMLLTASGCSAVNVGPELGLMAEATESTSARVLKVVNADPEAERQARLTNASAARPAQPWTFPAGCAPIPQVIDEAGVCVIDRGRGWNQPVQADAIRRKLRVISDYVVALSDMANAQNDSALTAAYSTALSALGGLADEAEMAALKDLVATLKAKETATKDVVTFALANRRARLLRSTVLQNREAFNDVVQEVIDGLMNETAEDDDLTAQYLTLDTLLNDAVVAGARGDTAAYRDALDRADRAYGAYLSARSQSIFASLAALAATHEALARRLQGPATLQEIETFTKSLADLRRSLS